MARIRHIALVVKDLEATADFYQKALGLKRSPLSEGPTARRIYMSDGHVNLALLQYKGETGSGLKDASGFVGVHHFGFQVDNLPKQQTQIENAGGQFFFDLGDPDDDDFERKFKDPNGIIFDINWKGWALTESKIKPKAKAGKRAGVATRSAKKAAPRKAAKARKGTKTRKASPTRSAKKSARKSVGRR